MKKDIASIHLIGVCGVAMGSLAGMLKSSGYHVTGSDEAVYPPMSDMLAEWDIRVSRGYSEEHVGNPDLVVVGNVISRGNAEVEYVLARRIPYRSMAQALRDFFLEGKEVVAVAGTHGKTTTTALLAHILIEAGLDPSFFVGGVPKNHGSNFRLGNGSHFIIEGDEYDSAFFEKVPKFAVYRPQHLVLTSLEFDHADIYRNLDEISLWFRRLVNVIPSNGNIVYSTAYPALRGAVGRSFAPCHSYGGTDADFFCEDDGVDGEWSRLVLHLPGARAIPLRSRLFGEFNRANIAAAAAMALRLGVSPDTLRRGVESFEGVKRRQELIYARENFMIYEDFAHHPTAIAGVIAMMRERFPLSRLWAVYEPRSATSRRNVFQNELPGAFAGADRVLIRAPDKLDGIPEAERIDIARAVGDINARGGSALVLCDVSSIVAVIFGEIDRMEDNVVIIMSNGGFDGIYDAMRAAADDFFMMNPSRG
ncbi:MAG TPA: Mur ligase domain-containing protein [Spirochaetota bacterium]|nr:Mur ligase domain-containing protein [Spirochaetota bacterium]